MLHLSLSFSCLYKRQFFLLHTAIVVIFQHDDKRGTGCEDVRNMCGVFRHCTVYTQRNTQRQSISIWNENEPCNEKSEGECTSRKKLSVNWKHGGLVVNLCFPLARPLFFFVNSLSTSVACFLINWKWFRIERWKVEKKRKDKCLLCLFAFSLPPSLFLFHCRR